MLYSKEETLEETLVRLVLKGPIQIKELHIQLSSAKKQMSLRAVYKAAGALICSGVFIKVGKNVWINQEWIRTLRESLLPTLPLLAPGERIAYTFTSVEHLDTFWKTIVFQLEEYEHDGQIFFYNPHNFWAYIPERKISEDAYYKHFQSTKKHAFFTVGSTSPADLQFKRAYQSEFFQVDMRLVQNLGRRNHITILGDFVIIARLSKQMAAYLDELYESGLSIEELLPKIIEVYEKTGKIRLIFEHNHAKAKKLRKTLSPNFYFKH